MEREGGLQDANLTKLTGQMPKTVIDLNKSVDKSMQKVSGTLDETTSTVAALHDKVDRLGETFLGRRLIGKPKSQAAATPVTAAIPRR